METQGHHRFKLKDPGFTRAPVNPLTAQVLESLGPDHAHFQQQQFIQTLRGYVELDGEPVRILDIGCGAAPYAPLVVSLFGDRAEYVGIDKEKLPIQRAPRAPRVDYIHGEALRLEEYVEGEFEVVLSRSPNIWNEDVWRRIYTKARGIMNGGLLIGTGFSLREHGLQKKALEGAGFTVEKAEQNPFITISSEDDNKFIMDNYVIFASP
ncbi:MAG: class I SAM-dependent methyltransferase [Candidatus Nanoarchaeia archaeon]